MGYENDESGDLVICLLRRVSRIWICDFSRWISLDNASSSNVSFGNESDFFMPKNLLEGTLGMPKIKKRRTGKTRRDSLLY